MTSVKNSKSYSLVRTVTERSLKSVVTLAIIAFVGLPHIDVAAFALGVQNMDETIGGGDGDPPTTV